MLKLMEHFSRTDSQCTLFVPILETVTMKQEMCWQCTTIQEIRNQIVTFTVNKKRCRLFQDGPMVPDVAPREASDRLIIFQNRFDTLYRKYQTYSGGEVLFGLPTTEHPELLQVPML